MYRYLFLIAIAGISLQIEMHANPPDEARLALQSTGATVIDLTDTTDTWYDVIPF